MKKYKLLECPTIDAIQEKISELAEKGWIVHTFLVSARGYYVALLENSFVEVGT